jgi:hypothetical protein
LGQSPNVVEGFKYMTKGFFELPVGRVGGSMLSAAECEWPLKSFVDRDAFFFYDFSAGYSKPSTNTIEVRHRYGMNRVMGAQSSRDAWDNFIGKPIPELVQIGIELDLVDGPDQEVRQG